MKIFILFLTTTLLLANHSNALTVEEIITKTNHTAYYQGDDGRANVHMVIKDTQGRERTRNFTILRKDVNATEDAEQMFYVYFSRPTDVNKTAFLVWKHVDKDDDRWLYLPALDLIKRIAANDERTSFVGSHFFYEDLSGRMPAEDKHELVDETDNYYVLQSTPRHPEQVEFKQYKSWIHKSTFLPIKIQFYDKTDQAYRMYEVLKVDDADGFPTVTQSRMSDNNIGGHSEMNFSKVRYNVDLPESVFSERFLRIAPRKYLR